MRPLTFALLMTAIPAVAAGQSSVAAGGNAQTDAGIGFDRATRGFSADGRAQAEAALQVAADQSLPQAPLISVLLEGQAKGAAEAQTIRAEQRQLARLQAAMQAMVEAGRPHPSGEEVTRGANLLARGVTRAQLGALTQRSPSDRSLVVAFETVSELAASGVPVSTAVAQIGARLETGASDAAIRSYGVSLASSADGGIQSAPAGTSAAASGNLAVSAAAGAGAGASGSAAGSVTAGVLSH